MVNSDEETNGDFIRKLVKKRDSAARRIVRIANNLENVSAVDANDIAIDAARIDRDDLEKCFLVFEDSQNEIEEDVSGDELAIQEAERIRIETLVRRARVSASNFLRRNVLPVDSNGNSPVVLNATAASKIKRPEITVPKFNGDVKKWSEFKNIFKSLVIDEKCYSDIERMIYLKQAVEGKAAELIANFEISKENFSKAWEKLRGRYENRRAVISKHLETLCKLPTAKSETDVAPLLDAATDAIESLSSVGVKNGWELMLCHLVSGKLDHETRKQWELSIVAEEEYPTYARLEKFLQQRVRVFESIGGSEATVKTSATPMVKKEKSKTLLTNTASTSVATKSNTPGTRLCFDCGSQHHSINECKNFITKPYSEKTLVIQKRGLCFNCLNRGHRVAFCRLKRCEKCDRKHHVLLHQDEPVPRREPTEQTTEPVKSETNSSVQTTAKTLLTTSNSSGRVILPAALVYVFGKNGHRFLVRTYLDSCGGINAISERLTKKLRCKVQSSSVLLSSLVPGEFKISHSCEITVKSRFDEFQLAGRFQVVPTVATDSASFNKNLLNNVDLKAYKFADDYNINSGCVDLLIGTEFFETVMLNGKIQVGEKAYLRESKFGWVFLGCTSSEPDMFGEPSACYLTLEANFQRFWTLDDFSETESTWTAEEKRVDDEFERTYGRGNFGKFLLFLPKQLSVEMLGESRIIAFSRLLSLEKRLARSEKVSSDYNKFLTEYETLNHMTCIDSADALVYLPHHPVFKAESSTTSTRVVFNAASPTSSGYSLNDFLAKGPVLQEDLFSILIRFRSHRIAFTADIEKMYRQVLIHPDDRKYQCILWRDPQTNLIRTYQLNTVTYGTKPASYLATKCLFKLAELFENQYPESCKIIRSDFYMDDLLSGSDSIEEAKSRVNEVVEILKSGGFPLRKFASNCVELLQDLDPSLIVESRVFEDVEAVTVLGVVWTARDGDRLRFFSKLKLEELETVFTKRSFLSKVFRIFDPLGLLAPIVVTLKFLLQDLWRCKLDWDDPVPPIIMDKFRIVCSEMKLLSSLVVPRWVELLPNSEIHVFCDASERGYGAAIYVRTVIGTEVRVHLLCAKSRVAPIKVVSLPRLELCAALLGAELLLKVKRALRLPETVPIFAWSDSTIVLSWICSDKPWKTFVANRVSQIRSITSPNQWCHVRSENNAADIISRGLVSDFGRLIEFWTGPSFLKGGVNFLPFVELDPKALEESKGESVQVCLVQSSTDCLLQRFSSYNRLILFVAYIMRFSKTIRKECYDDLTLTPFERLRAHKILVKREQSFIGDRIRKLDCFQDNDGIWRLRSRLGKSDLTYDAKYPIILRNGRFLLLFIRYLHLRYFHAAAPFLRNFVRSSYEVLGDLNRLIRGVIYRCVTCRRYAQDLQYNPPVGELPLSRVTVSQAFVEVGVDFAGPFAVRAMGPSGNRGKVIFKSYVAVFVCMATRACHLEVVEDLSTKGFLDAFSRFVARRGMCAKVFSDHGTNFVGADRELKAAFKFLHSQKSDLVSHCSQLGIYWQFIPERAPHFGGLWEAAVKSFKHHFKRVVGSQVLSFSELNTLCCQIEAALNSRPLCTHSDNLSTVLTPAHLCIGRSVSLVPALPGAVLTGSIKIRYSLVRNMFDRFWAIWRHEYLMALRKGYFKKCGSRQAQVGDVVLLKEDNVKPADWPLGRIVECHPGTDGVCRVVDVRSNSKVFRRPVVKLVPLLPE